MGVYFVGYDLTRKPYESYENLIAAIKQYGTYWGNLDSTWLISTTQTTSQIRDHLWQHMHSNDRLLVVKLAPEAAWDGSFAQTAQEWLKNQIPSA